MLGYCVTGSISPETAPAMSRMSASTAANTGLCMKKNAILIRPSSHAGFLLIVDALAPGRRDGPSAALPE